MRLHNRVAELMEQRGRLEHRTISLRELSKRTGIHRNNMGRWIRDEPLDTITTAHVVALCTYFLCKVDRLLYLA